ncbi:hypothetical protein O3P69_013732 [Scylla paramamosain]|uniref:Uncharacterized protein n=1 Tax=Scylla paramamosain TaxID=85552 RepID=A0AAW0SPM6_SCYPA
MGDAPKAVTQYSISSHGVRNHDSHNYNFQIRSVLNNASKAGRRSNLDCHTESGVASFVSPGKPSQTINRVAAAAISGARWR